MLNYVYDCGIIMYIIKLEVINMPQILPIKDLRNTSEISELCHKKAEPVFITKNGYGDMVVMSMETYEKQLAISEIYDKIFLAEKQIKEGALFDAEEVIDRLSEKYGH